MTITTSASSFRTTVLGIPVEVVRKDIRNLHIGVHPPHGRVRVAAPLLLSDEAIRLAVVERLAWIKKHKRNFENQPRQSKREMVNGECHYYLGRRYRLRVHEHTGNNRVALRGLATMDLFVRPGTTAAEREAALLAWYRRQLRAMIPPLLEKWLPVIGVQAPAWGIRKMKTKWGSYSRVTSRVWFNLELAKRPPQCLEYIMVHELVHSLERHHNKRFVALMDGFMPRWRQYRDMLNETPLGHEVWDH